MGFSVCTLASNSVVEGCNHIEPIFIPPTCSNGRSYASDKIGRFLTRTSAALSPIHEMRGESFDVASTKVMCRPNAFASLFIRSRLSRR